MQVLIVGVDVVQVQVVVEQGFYIVLVVGLLVYLFYEVVYVWVVVEVQCYVILCLVVVNVQVVGQVEGVYVVYQVEVDCFGGVVFVWGYFFQCVFEYFGGGGMVYVGVLFEGVYQVWVFGQVCYDFQFDL